MQFFKRTLYSIIQTWLFKFKGLPNPKPFSWPKHMRGFPLVPSNFQARKTNKRSLIVHGENLALVWLHNIFPNLFKIFLAEILGLGTPLIKHHLGIKT